MNITSEIKRCETQIMQLPNVTGIGIGKKGGKDVIKVFVTQKLPESALRPDEVIPKALGKYDVDVEEIGVVMAQV
ncbi:hypothetical protein MTYM_01207 [Methylococcales bacterium]|nr:hypothetical protein MTYM_01207 [Methylococcales bacterium]